MTVDRELSGGKENRHLKEWTTDVMPPGATGTSLVQKDWGDSTGGAEGGSKKSTLRLLMATTNSRPGTTFQSKKPDRWAWGSTRGRTMRLVLEQKT